MAEVTFWKLIKASAEIKALVDLYDELNADHHLSQAEINVLILDGLLPVLRHFGVEVSREDIAEAIRSEQMSQVREDELNLKLSQLQGKIARLTVQLDQHKETIADFEAKNEQLKHFLNS